MWRNPTASQPDHTLSDEEQGQVSSSRDLPRRMQAGCPSEATHYGPARADVMVRPTPRRTLPSLKRQRLAQRCAPRVARQRRLQRGCAQLRCLLLRRGRFACKGHEAPGGFSSLPRAGRVPKAFRAVVDAVFTAKAAAAAAAAPLLAVHKWRLIAAACCHASCSSNCRPRAHGVCLDRCVCGCCRRRHDIWLGIVRPGAGTLRQAR